MNRRSFLLRTAATGLVLGSPTLRSATASPPHVATNTYPWGTFAGRDGGSFKLHTDDALAAIARTGITGYEPIITAPEEFDGLGARLKAHGLEMRSLYVNSTLHDESAQASIDSVLAIARRAVEIGTRIIVTNPSPIRWGGPDNKTDAQLRAQAHALDRLGAELRTLGAALAYHNHDIELRLGAREFHHMLTATDPANVKLCLDAHWVFRGCGDSQVALFDAVEHYGRRIVELHLRQSHNGIWTEVFQSEGDIDYARLRAWLRQHEIKPHLVLEQAVEAGSPKTVDVIAAHRQGLAQVLRLFPGSA